MKKKVVIILSLIIFLFILIPNVTNRVKYTKVENVEKIIFVDSGRLKEITEEKDIKATLNVLNSIVYIRIPSFTSVKGRIYAFKIINKAGETKVISISTSYITIGDDMYIGNPWLNNKIKELYKQMNYIEQKI